MCSCVRACVRAHREGGGSQDHHPSSVSGVLLPDASRAQMCMFAWQAWGRVLGEVVQPELHSHEPHFHYRVEHGAFGRAVCLWAVVLTAAAVVVEVVLAGGGDGSGSDDNRRGGIGWHNE